MTEEEVILIRRYSYLPWVFELPLLVLARLLYRVKVRNAERLPKQGGVLVLPNHLSYVDVIVLQLASPRRLRFVADRSLCRQWLLNWIFELTGTIIVDPRNPLDCMRRVKAALDAGEAVCTFPEGSISRTGQLMALRRGFELMARNSRCPVVPVAHDGLWGSMFSFSGNKYLFKSPRMTRTPVSVCFGHPVKPSEVSVDRIRKDLLDLGALALSDRPVLQRHLAWELARSLAKRPLALQVVDRTGERSEMSSMKLLGVATAYARTLRSIPERRIGVVLPPGRGAFVANLAVILADKVPVNFNFTAGRAALEKSFVASGVNVVLSSPLVQAKLPDFPWPEKTRDVKKDLLSLPRLAVLRWVALAGLCPNQWYPRFAGIPRDGGDKEAGLLFTSGSSGDPKGVVLSHKNLLTNCWQISSLSILPGSATILACLPIFHSFGFTVTLWYPLLRGCKVVTVPSPLETRKIAEAINVEEATVLVAAPTFLRPLLKRAYPGELKSLELIVSGAERLPDELRDGFQNQFHSRIMQGYGLTETTPVISVNQPDPPYNERTGEKQTGARNGSVGRMLPGITARIVNPDTFEELPLSATGLLLVKASNVFDGYLADPIRTSTVFREGWFVTGDLARFDEDGFLFVEGRITRFSKIGGEMVPHGTVEDRILEVLGETLEEAKTLFVVGVPDETKGETLVLLTTRNLELNTLRPKLNEIGLPALWVPKVILRVDSIPMLGTGKIDMHACNRLAREWVARTA